MGYIITYRERKIVENTRNVLTKRETHIILKNVRYDLFIREES